MQDYFTLDDLQELYQKGVRQLSLSPYAYNKLKALAEANGEDITYLSYTTKIEIKEAK